MELKTDTNYSDDQLIMMINENNDDAKDYLFHKYSALIHKEINRYKSAAYTLKIDISDLSQEAMLGFSDAIINFKSDENAKFITFATLCIRRKIFNLLRKHASGNNELLRLGIEGDQLLEGSNVSIIENIQESESKEPLNKMIVKETLKELYDDIDDKLSSGEKEALFKNMNGESIESIAKAMNKTPKQIYNLLYRARQKLK